MENKFKVNSKVKPFYVPNVSLTKEICAEFFGSDKTTIDVKRLKKIKLRKQKELHHQELDNICLVLDLLKQGFRPSDYSIDKAYMSASKLRIFIDDSKNYPND